MQHYISESNSPKNLEPTANNPSQEAQICRICLDFRVTPETGAMLQPCHCKGSIAYVHSNCLKKAVAFMSKSHNDIIHCKICGQEYKMEVSIKYSPTCRVFRKDRIVPMIFLIIFLAVTSGVLHLNIVGVQEMINEITSTSNEKSKIYILGIALGLMFLKLFRLVCVIVGLVRESFWRLEASWRIYNCDAVVKEDSKLTWKLYQLLSAEQFLHSMEYE